MNSQVRSLDRSVNKVITIDKGLGAESRLRGDGRRELALSQAMQVLEQYPACSGAIGYDLFTRKFVVRKPLPWDTFAYFPGGAITGVGSAWNDRQSARGASWMQQRFNIAIGVHEMTSAVTAVAEKDSFHSLQSYLNGLPGWDGKPRADAWPITYLGAENSLYVRAVGKRWLVSMIARAFEPGVKVDHCLVLNGIKGLKKSTTFEILGGSFYKSLTGSLDDEARKSLLGKWIIDFNELNAISGRRIEQVKAFLTERSDHLRLAYDRNHEDCARQCVFCGTTNDGDFLSFTDGDERRIWPVDVRSELREQEFRRDANQLIAEAMVLYRAREPWHLETVELRKLAVEEREKYRFEMPAKEVIRVALGKRRSVSTALTDGEIETWDLAENGITVAEALRLCLNMPRPQLGSGLSDKRVAGYLCELGWERRRERKVKGNVDKHGKQIRDWAYFPPNDWRFSGE